MSQEVATYSRKVAYYETDQMAIVHHSNYIRWMEEARIAYLDELGCGFDKMEADGLISPVTGVSCTYKTPCTFGDTVAIGVKLTEYSGVRYGVRYEMYNHASGQLLAVGRTDHCFTNASGRPVALRRQLPQYDELFKSMIEE